MPKKKQTRRVPPKPYDRISFLGLEELRRTTIDPETDAPILAKEIARRAGINQQAYSKIECGSVRNPSKDKVRAIANAFGKSYDELLNAMPAAEERKKDPKAPFIPHYTISVEPEGYDYYDCVLADKTNTIEEPFYLRHCDGFAITVPSDTMFPRYKEGDILFCNPETKPQVGDDVVIEIKQVTRTICIIREIVDIQPNQDRDGDQAYSYGVMSALQKDRLRCQNYEKEKHVATGLAHHANFVTEIGYLVEDAEYFYIQDPDDNKNLIRDESGRPLKKDDGSYLTKADLTALTEFLGGTVRPDRSCIRITTVVGSQRHRNPKVAKHWFLSPQSAVIARAEVGQVAIITSEDNEAAPVEPKEDAEVQKIAKPKFGDFQGFKRT